MNKEIKEFSPNIEHLTNDQKVYIRDNAVEIRNTGNTTVKLDDFILEPQDYIRVPFTKAHYVCVWNFFLKFGSTNVLDTGDVKKQVTVIRTNFHDAKVSNYKAK